MDPYRLCSTFCFRASLMESKYCREKLDEFSHVDTGYKYIELLSHGDYTNPFWTDFSDQPPLVGYFYGTTLTEIIQEKLQGSICNTRRTPLVKAYKHT